MTFEPWGSTHAQLGFKYLASQPEGVYMPLTLDPVYSIHSWDVSYSCLLTLVKILSMTPFSLSSVLISNRRACSASDWNLWGVSLFGIPWNLRYSSGVFWSSSDEPSWRSCGSDQGFSDLWSSTFCVCACMCVRVCVHVCVCEGSKAYTFH